MKRAMNKRLTLHKLKKKVPFALTFLRAVTTSSLKKTQESVHSDCVDMKNKSYRYLYGPSSCKTRQGIKKKKRSQPPK